MKLHLQILTPERKVLDEEVEKVTIPTQKGQMGILPRHIGLLTEVEPGELIYEKQGKKHFFAVNGGFAQVGKDNVNILSDYAIRSDDIEIAKAEEAKKRAEKLIQERQSEEDTARIEATLRRSLLELNVATKRKRRQT